MIEILNNTKIVTKYELRPGGKDWLFDPKSINYNLIKKIVAYDLTPDK